MIEVSKLTLSPKLHNHRDRYRIKILQEPNLEEKTKKEMKHFSNKKRK